MGQPFYYVAGPVHIYVRCGNPGFNHDTDPTSRRYASGVQMLGHTVADPKPDFIAKYLDVFSSLSGPVIPDDKIFAGQECKLDLELARFDFTTLLQLENYPTFAGAGGVGREAWDARGRLAIAQGDNYEVWLRNAFFGTPNAAAYPNLPIGYYFYACTTDSILPRNLSRDATKAQLAVQPLGLRLGITGGVVYYSCDPLDFDFLPAPT